MAHSHIDPRHAAQLVAHRAAVVHLGSGQGFSPDESECNDDTSPTVDTVGVRRESSTMILSATVTCPNCRHQATEEMPANACVHFYQCSACRTVLRSEERRVGKERR